MSYTITTIEDHEQSIFEGLDCLCRPDTVLPPSWAETLGEDELDWSFVGRAVTNTRIDIEIECWGRRLA
jgi:hypothetical protein